MLRRRRRSRVSIALVGGFDADNYGDALFPLLARTALEARLPVRLTMYGFRDLAPGLRPYAVRDLARLPAEIGAYDLMLLGGGQLVRGDPLGPAFPPASPDVHDPLGIWLVPTVTAQLAGVPVAWNAPGVSPTIPEALDPLVAAAVAGVRHLVVRDEQSSRWLAERAGVEAAVSPDTAFALGGGPRPALGEEAAAALAAAGMGRSYVVVQPTAQLDPWREEIAAALAGADVLELPIGPVGGDAVGAVGWPSPWAIAELIANAAGAVGMSYHLGVTAAAFGVPLLRPPSPPGWKYELLETLPGVTVLGSGAAVRWGAGPPSREVRALAAAVEAHWDAVAALAETGGAGHVDVSPLVAALERVTPAGVAAP